MMLAVTDFTLDALHILRDPSQFKWVTVTLLVICMYIYTVEVERGRFDIVLAGLAFWFMDWINEIVNSLILHFTDRAALWTTTGDTSFLILIGLNIEISMMFFIAGVMYVKSLPSDPKQKILGVPNRLFLATTFSLFAVFVEILLVQTGYFHWEYWWWNTPFIPLIVIFGYMTFFLVSGWVYDMPERKRQIKAVLALGSTVAAALLLFGPILNWN